MNENRVRIGFLIAILCFMTLAQSIASPLFSGEVVLEGLDKTRDSVILAMVPFEQGQDLSYGDIRELEQTIMKSGIFSTVQVEVLSNIDETADILVSVEEKWTLIPVPYFATDGESYNGGLFLIEANLFGYNTFLMTALYGGSNGLRGLTVLSNPAVAGSPWALTGTAGGGTRRIATVLPDGSLVRSHLSRYVDIGIGVGNRLSPRFSIEGKATVKSRSILEMTTGLDTDPIGDTTFIEPELLLTYSHTTLVDVLEVGTIALISSRFLLIEEGWELDGALSWSTRVGPTHRLRLMTSLGYGRMPVIAESTVDAKDGFRTLPFKKTTADRWASIAAFYDIPVVRTSWGTAVVSHYWELGMYETDEIPKRIIFGGPGFGFRLYLRKIALPAVGVDIARNLYDPYWNFSVSVGLQM